MKAGDLVRIHNNWRLNRPMGHGLLLRMHNRWWQVLDERGDVVTWNAENLEVVSEGR